MKKYLLYNPTNGEWNSDPMTLDEIRALTPGAEETYVAELLEDGTTGPTITLAPAEEPTLAPDPAPIPWKTEQHQPKNTTREKPKPAPITKEQKHTYSLIRTTCKTIILMICATIILGCISIGSAIAVAEHADRLTGILFGALTGLALVLIGRAIVTD